MNKHASVLLVYHGGKFKDLYPIIKFLRSNGLKHITKERDCLTDSCHKGHDLILVIGGDGTFLRASHHNPNLPMFGINPRPDKKEGFYMQADVHNYKQKLLKVINKDYKIIDLLRLNIEINSKKINQSALNDVYIGDARPYMVFNYHVKINGKTEFQRSSGVLIGTPSGSYAWLKSAGGSVMDFKDNKYQFLARELYEGKLTKDYKFRNLILDAKQSVEITCKKPGIVVIDSISPEYKLEKGDKVKVYVGSYLKYIKL